MFVDFNIKPSFYFVGILGIKGFVGNEKSVLDIEA
jgi:hypothetical protein